MTSDEFIKDYRRSGVLVKREGMPRNVYALMSSRLPSAPVNGMTRRGYFEGLAYLCGVNISHLGSNVVKISYQPYNRSPKIRK